VPEQLIRRPTLEQQLGREVKRGHVYELFSAIFGHSSWAAFQSKALLADAGVGSSPVNPEPLLFGRALQLGYDSDVARSIAQTMLTLSVEARLSCVMWASIDSLLQDPPPPRPSPTDHDWDDEDHDWDDEDDGDPEISESNTDRPALLDSPLLLSSLDGISASLSPQRHHALAALYRCQRPNPYLHQESMRGRQLTVIEQGWVRDYLRTEPLFRRYQAHLKAAAMGGIRQAAIEYAEAFEDKTFFEMAERMTGPADPDKMAAIAPDLRTREAWLRVAASEGSMSALQRLAEAGDESALEQLASRGDRDALYEMAQRALKRGDLSTAWVWQHVAQLHGLDLTVSTMTARHEGGARDGEFYDSDFGGPLYVSGDEGLALAPLKAADDGEALEKPWPSTRSTGRRSRSASRWDAEHDNAQAVVLSTPREAGFPGV
jgi:hypothetical protein